MWIAIRAGLSILGALGKFHSSGPPKAFHAEAVDHYSTIYKQHIAKHLTMHACKYSIHGNLLLNVYIVVFAGYSMCYNVTMKVCLELKLIHMIHSRHNRYALRT